MKALVYLALVAILWGAQAYVGGAINTPRDVRVVRWSLVIVVTGVLLLDVWREQRRWRS